MAPHAVSESGGSGHVDYALTGDPVSDQRQQQLVSAVDDLIAVKDRWENDPDGPLYLTDRVEQGIETLREIHDAGIIPRRCVALSREIQDFLLEYDLYQNGSMNRSKGPLSSFWKAFRKMVAMRQPVTEVQPQSPPPAKQLLAQNVSMNQIANYIYGHRGTGPFIVNGQIREDLILKEAEEPGSVVPTGWIHPSERDRLQLHQQTSRERLIAADQTIANARLDDPQGDSSPEPVAPPSWEITQVDHQPKFNPGSSPPKTSPLNTVDQVIAKIYQVNAEASASEILGKVKEQLGDDGNDVTVQKVTAVIRSIKQADANNSDAT